MYLYLSANQQKMLMYLLSTALVILLLSKWTGNIKSTNTRVIMAARTTEQ